MTNPWDYASRMADKAAHGLRQIHRTDGGVRDYLGMVVREAWVKWARGRRAAGHEVPDHHLDPWEALSEPNKEVDRQIGVAVAARALEGFQAAILRGPEDAQRLQHALGLGDRDYDIELQIRTIQEMREKLGLPVIPAPRLSLDALMELYWLADRPSAPPRIPPSNLPYDVEEEALRQLAEDPEKLREAIDTEQLPVNLIPRAQELLASLGTKGR